jgi:hypothetical protein
VYKDWELTLKTSYITTGRICVHHAEQVRLRSFERDRIQGLRAYAQDTVLRKTRIDVLYTKQSYEPFSWKSCPRPPSGICEYPHEPARGIELAPDCHIYVRLRICYPPLRTVTRPPLASMNTFTNPPGEYRAGTWLPLTFMNGYGPATYPYEPLRDPPGICEYSHKPARGIRAGT